MSKGKIIIADDEAIIRMDLKEMLEAEGYEVIAEASDGEKAYELLMSLDPDLAILDINMPKMDGISVARKLKNQKQIPIVILTAYSQESMVEEAAKLGIFGYLIKPVREEQLFSTLEISRRRFIDFQELLGEYQEIEEKFKGKSVISEAVALFMNQYGLSEEACYQRMRKYSMEKRISLEEVAKAIIKTKALEKK